MNGANGGGGCSFVIIVFLDKHSYEKSASTAFALGEEHKIFAFEKRLAQVTLQIIFYISKSRVRLKDSCENPIDTLEAVLLYKSVCMLRMPLVAAANAH